MHTLKRLVGVLAALLVMSCAGQPKAPPDDLAAQKQAAEEQLAAANAKIADLQKQVDNLKAQQQMNASDQLAAANKRADDLEAEVAGLKSDAAAKSAQIDTLNAKIASLQKINDDLSVNLKSLQTGSTKTSADYLAQIAGLNKDIAVLQDTISTLQQQNAAADAALKKSDQDLTDRVNQLKNLFSKEIASGDIAIDRYRDVLVVSAKDSVFFVPDWPTLLPGGQATLQKMAEVFKKAPDRVVRVQGNTATAASSPDSLKLYPTSWHLGAARAANVVQYLQDSCGMDPNQLLVASLGQYSPIADNATEQGKAKNRRVDFVLIARDLWELDRLKPVVGP